MTSASHSLTAPGTAARASWRVMKPRWRSLTRDEVRAAFYLECGLVAINVVMFKRQFFVEDLLFLPARMGVGMIGCLALLFGVVAAEDMDNAAARRTIVVLAVVVSGIVEACLSGFMDPFGAPGHAAVYVIVLGLIATRAARNVVLGRCLMALAIAAALALFAVDWRELFQDPDYAKEIGATVQRARFAFYQWVLLAGAATFAYLDWRRTRLARRRTHAAALERAAAAKRALESRLQALQARVEPQFLFNTLTRVKAMHRVDPEGGERMLDDLIAYLRAAMPTMRDTSSTVGQELELVRAYLAIAGQRLGERLDHDVATAVPQVAQARMPPMMLLPLIDHAVACEAVDPAARRRLEVRAKLANGSVRIEVADNGRSFGMQAMSGASAAIRERLAALYGERARLELTDAAHEGSRAVLAFPCETEPVAAPPEPA